MSRLLSTLVLAAICGATQAQETRPATAPAAKPHPLSLDRTGIRWVYPFKAALAKAKKEGRLLLFLPLAGGTNHKGNW